MNRPLRATDFDRLDPVTRALMGACGGLLIFAVVSLFLPRDIWQIVAGLFMVVVGYGILAALIAVAAWLIVAAVRG